MIKIDSVSKSFGDKLVLDGINLTLKEPTIYGLVGINGSGKSTLLRIIAGIYRPDQGRVTIDGEDVLQNPEKAKSSFFFLNDNPYYSPLWKAKDFVSFYSCFYPEFDKEELNRVLNILELDVSHRISTFSKGMKRQFFLALAFASGAKTLLFDEAFDGLDPLSRLKMKKILVEKMEKGLTCLISSHSLRELEDIVDGFGLLDGGKLIDHKMVAEGKAPFVKFQLAAKEELPEEAFSFLHPVSLKRNGKIVEIVLRGEAEEQREKLETLHPVFLEQVGIRLEDLFLIEVEKSKEEGK